MRKLTVSTLVTLDGVIQDPGGFGEIAEGGWANPYFTEEASQEAYEHLMAEQFLRGRLSRRPERRPLKGERPAARISREKRSSPTGARARACRPGRPRSRSSVGVVSRR
jgi:hypothetical protein